MSGIAGQFHGTERIGRLETERSRWVAIAVFSVLGVTLFRIICLAFDRTDLFVDEAQYWLWSREMARRQTLAAVTEGARSVSLAQLLGPSFAIDPLMLRTWLRR